MFSSPPIIFYTALSLIRYFMYLIHINALQEAFIKLRSIAQIVSGLQMYNSMCF